MTGIVHQGQRFLLVGLFLVAVDWLVTAILGHAGLPLEVANVSGRVCGALLGFLLNGKITFARNDVKLGHRHFFRFVAFWLLSTLVSTVLVGLIGRHFDLRLALLAKPFVEIFLAAIGFLVSRSWIYR
jgi:putative flippase GtrA